MLLPNLSSSLLGPGCSRLGVHELALPSNVLLLVVPDGDAGGPPTTLYIAEAVVGTTAVVVVVDVALMATTRTDL